MDDSKNLSNESSRASHLWLALAVFWAVGFFVWFQSFGLPNNNQVPRWQIWSSLPFDLLDLIDPQAVAGSAPWSWLFLFQRVPYALAGLAIWAGATACGSLILRWLKVLPGNPDRTFFSTCVGLSFLSLIVLALGLLGLLNRWILATALLIAVTIEFGFRRKALSNRSVIDSQSDNSAIPSSIWTYVDWLILLTSILFAAVLIFGGMTPQNDFDACEYHLGGPKEWYQQGRIVRLPHNVYTSFPFLSEMLILLGMVLCDDWRWGALAGQGVLAGFAPLTGYGLYAAGRRWFSERAGLLASLIYLTSPWTYRISIITGTEGTLSCFLFASLFATLLLHDQILRDPAMRSSIKLALLVGILSGSAMACKYPGMISAVIPIGLFVFGIGFLNSQSLRLKSGLRIGLMFAIGVIASVGPWLIKSSIETHNPVYPLAVHIFGGTDRDEEIDEKFRNGHSTGYVRWSDSLRDLPQKLTDVVTENDWHSPLMFCLAPLSLFWWQRRQRPDQSVDRVALGQGFVLGLTWLYVIWQFVTWWLLTHHIDRFYVPMFSSVAFLAGVGATWPNAFPSSPSARSRKIWSCLSTCVILASVLYNAEIMLLIGGFNAGRMDLAAASDIATAPRIRWLNSEFESGHFPANMKMLCVGEAQLFHCRYPYIYNTVFDHSIFEQLCVIPGSRPQKLREADEIKAEFHRLGITHIDVNWAEILRYRAPGSYGYTDFACPDTFMELQRIGLLGRPLNLPASIALNRLDTETETQLRKWGPGLITTFEGKPAYISAQVFPILD